MKISCFLNTSLICNKVLSLLIILFCAGNLHAQSTIWTGAVNSDWFDGANWSNGVPDANHLALIYNTPANYPFIDPGTAAVARSLYINPGSGVIVLGSLTIAGLDVYSIENYGLLVNNGTIEIGGDANAANDMCIRNYGTFESGPDGVINLYKASNIYIQNNNGALFTNLGSITAGAGSSTSGYGIYNTGAFTNYAGGDINIDRVTLTALVHGAGNGSFLNEGTINIGAVAGAGQYGISNDNTFENAIDGEITIDRTSIAGLSNSNNCNFNNYGALSIGGMASVGEWGIVNWGTFSNDYAGDILLERAVQSGIYNSYIFYNFTMIRIGVTAGCGDYGIENLLDFFNNGDLLINRSATCGIINHSYFGNTATLQIGAVASPGSHGIINYGNLQNAYDAQLSINRSTAAGIENAIDGIISNYSNISIGGLENAGDYGIYNYGAIFNEAGGSIYIDRVAESSIENEGSCMNYGLIAIGETAGAGNSGIQNTVEFTNYSGGEIRLSRCNNYGLKNISGTFTNEAQIVIGAQGSTISNGISNFSNFINNAGGEIGIDNCQYAFTNEAGIVDNFAQIIIGGNSGCFIGLKNFQSFVNHTGATINIDQVTVAGLMNSGEFLNEALINIGQNAAGGEYGIVNNQLTNSVVFQNDPGSVIQIDRTTIGGISNDAAEFYNYAQIAIGKNAGAGDYGIHNLALFINYYCAFLEMSAPLHNGGDLYTGGLFRVNTAGAHTNTGAAYNYGVIEYPQNNPIPNVTNIHIIATPLEGDCIVENALQIGNLNGIAIGSTWYSDETLANAAGTYDETTNAFTVTNLTEGAHTLYFNVHNNAQNCDQTVSVQLDLLDATPPTVVCQDITVNLGGDGTATIPVEQALNAAASHDDCGTVVPVSVDPGIVTCSQLGNNTLTLTASDNSGNTATCSANVVVNDVTLPTISCPGNQTLPPNSTNPCSAIVNGIDAAYNDNCTGLSLTYQLSGATGGSGNGQASGLSFLPGLTTVTYTATDAAALTKTCSFTVTVSNCAGISISGAIRWEHDGASGVNTTTVKVTGSGTGTDLSDADGLYEVTLSGTTGNFTVTPTKNINKLNGLSSADATAVQQHVTNLNPLPGPFKRIAADVNKSNSISTLDATLINQVLLGNPQANAIFNTSWRFVPSSYSFPNPDIPWGFPEKITLNNVSGNITGQDFKGIKLGDVAPVWANPANFGAGDPEASGLVFRVQDRELEAGLEIVAEFRADQFNDLNSFQFALQFNPEQLKLVEIEPLSGLPLSMENFGTYNVEEGEIRVVWSQATSVLLSEAAPLFRLRFKALENGALLSEVLQMNPEGSELPGHVYNSKYAESGVELQFFTPTAAEPGPSEPGLSLDNQPNPFVELTTLRFGLPAAGEAELRVTDVSGRLLFSQKKFYAAGQHQEILQLGDVSGVLFAELVTERGSVLQKMLAVKN